MKCHVCGSKLEKIITDMPFKLDNKTIIILKELPIWQCNNCTEFLLDDEVMKRVETILEGVNKAAELEIVRYAA
ncbi:MAG: type II toxin-antitoxin system MqsA family antitoxin [Candidatus Magnetoovum sp. WYHC-5]|nr:type II toxin-antitoxin system MqsA family antitoxin [Candidatus Magnetoovum sp. WYHC-5]